MSHAINLDFDVMWIFVDWDKRLPPKRMVPCGNHSNVPITLDTYSHVLSKIQDESANEVANLLRGG